MRGLFYPLMAFCLALFIALCPGSAFACAPIGGVRTFLGETGILLGLGCFIVLCQMAAYSFYRRFFPHLPPHHDRFIYPGIYIYAFWLSNGARHFLSDAEYYGRVLMLWALAIVALMAIEWVYRRFRPFYSDKAKDFFRKAYPGLVIFGLFAAVVHQNVYYFREVTAAIIAWYITCEAALQAHSRIMRLAEERRDRVARRMIALAFVLMFALPVAGISYNSMETTRIYGKGLHFTPRESPGPLDPKGLEGLNPG